MKLIKAMLSCAIAVFVLAECSISLFADNWPNISAQCAILIEMDSGKVLFEKNAHKCVQMASTTKIMSTILTLESGDLDSEFVVDTNAIMVEGSSMGLRPNDVVTKRILCYGMMLPSGNDAANAAAVKVAGSVEAFVDLMNNKATELGLNNTHFMTPSGLDDNTDEHYSCAYDMAVLSLYTMQNDDFKAICSTKEISFDVGSERKVWLSNSNKLLRSFGGCIGIKTGFTDKAGRCLISCVERDGVSLICVTLNAPDDWQDHKKLYEYAFDELSVYSIGDIFVNIPAVGGNKDVVTLYAEKEMLVFPNHDDTIIEKKIFVPRFVYAPIEKGEILGRIDYYTESGQIYSVPLYLLESIMAK